MARTTWFLRSRRKVRVTRGESWLDASCSTSIVTEKTSPVNVSIAAAIVDRMARALSGPPSNRKKPLASGPRVRSNASAARTVSPKMSTSE